MTPTAQAPDRPAPMPPRDPFEPLEVAIVVALTAIVGLTLVVGAVAILVDRVALPDLLDPVCVSDTSMTGSHSGLDGAFGTRPGVSIAVDGPRFCLDVASNGQRGRYLMHRVIDVGFPIGALVGALLVIRRARRLGPFTDRTARGVQLLGRYLVLGAAVHHVTTAVLAGMLLGDMRDDVWPYAMALDPRHVLWSAVFTGLGLITFARLMRLAAEMREDLDGVV
jgi:hypothetical protein